MQKTKATNPLFQWWNIDFSGQIYVYSFSYKQTFPQKLTPVGKKVKLEWSKLGFLEYMQRSRRPL